MRYDFHRLKPVTCYDAIALRIPERWDVSEDAGDTWGYYEKDAEDPTESDTGTLWISLYHFDAPGARDDLDIRDYIDDLVGTLRDEHSGTIKEFPTETVYGGFLSRSVSDGPGNGEPLRFFHYDYFVSMERYWCHIRISFVVTRTQLNDPEFQLLIRIMEREIRAARIDPFWQLQRERAFETFGPLQQCDFSSQIKLFLPEAIGWGAHKNPDDPHEYQWHGSLETDHSHATLFVYSIDCTLWERDDDALRINEGDIAGLLTRKMPFPVIGTVSFPVPQGKIDYRVTDDRKKGEAIRLDPGRENHPLQHYRWRYLCYAGGLVREMQLLIMLPMAVVDRSPYPQLIAYMRGEIRRAKFPDLTPKKHPSWTA